MTAISSKIAITVSKILCEKGTRDLKKDIIPKVKEISVAIGIAHPLRYTGL